MRRQPSGAHPIPSEPSSVYVFCAMPKRGVLSSRLESLQGPFGGREGGVPENVESDAALRAKQLRLRQIYARAQAKGC